MIDVTYNCHAQFKPHKKHLFLTEFTWTYSSTFNNVCFVKEDYVS